MNTQELKARALELLAEGIPVYLIAAQTDLPISVVAELKEKLEYDQRMALIKERVVNSPKKKPGWNHVKRSK